VFAFEGTVQGNLAALEVLARVQKIRRDNGTSCNTVELEPEGVLPRYRDRDSACFAKPPVPGLGWRRGARWG